MIHLVIYFVVVWLVASASVGAICAIIVLVLVPLIVDGGLGLGFSEFAAYFMIATFGGVTVTGLPCLIFALMMLQLSKRFGWARKRIAWSVVGVGVAVLCLAVPSIRHGEMLFNFGLFIAVAVAGIGSAWLFHMLLSPMVFLKEWSHSKSVTKSTVGDERV